MIPGLQNAEFVKIIKNTLLLCVLTVPLSTFIALVIAVSLNSIKFLNRTLQTIYFLPYVTNSIAIGIVFAAMFTMTTIKNDGETIIVTAGIVNDIIGVFGIEPIDWLGPKSTYGQNIFVMVVYIVWNALPFKILILLGGLIVLVVELHVLDGGSLVVGGQGELEDVLLVALLAAMHQLTLQSISVHTNTHRREFD